MLVVQLFNRESRQFGEFDDLNKSYLDANLDAMKVFAFFFPIVSFLATLATWRSYGTGRARCSRARSRWVCWWPSSSTDLAFQPIRDLAEKYNIMQAAMAAAERVFMLLDEQPTVVDAPTTKALGKVVGDIELQDVHFAYNPNEPVLKGVSFRYRLERAWPSWARRARARRA